MGSGQLINSLKLFTYCPFWNMSGLKLVRSSENETSSEKNLQNKSIDARHGTGKYIGTCSLASTS